MNTIRLCLLFLLTTCTAASAWAADPSGTWKFKAEGANGRSVEATLTLTWVDHQLSGKVDNRAGPAAISDASFADNQVRFTVVREFGRGSRQQKFVTHYSGKIDGDKISGTIETTGREKKPISVPWEAQRVQGN